MCSDVDICRGLSDNCIVCINCIAKNKIILHGIPENYNQFMCCKFQTYLINLCNDAQNVFAHSERI